MGLDKQDSEGVRLGKTVRALRLMRRMKQKDLGLALGVSPQQIQKYESGKNVLSPDKLRICARVFDVPMIYFFPPANDGRGRDGRSELDLLADKANLEFLIALTAIKDQAIKKLMLQFAQAIVAVEGRKKP